MLYAMNYFCMKRLAILLVALTSASACAGGAPAAKGYRVSYHDLSEAADGEKPSEFVASIDAMEGLSAELLSATATGDWKLPPKHVPPPDWISLVKVKIGPQCDFLAFTFADREGTVTYAAHRPSRIKRVLYWFNVPPGPGQIPMNAIRECATDFLFERPRVNARPRTKLRVRVGPWPKQDEADAEEPEGDAGLLEGAGPASGSVDLTAMEALAFAAAYEAGWQPTAASGDNAVTVQLREDFSVYFALRARLALDGRETVVSRERVPREKLYPNLVRVFQQLAPAAPFQSSAYLGSHEARLLGWRKGLCLVQDGNRVSAIRPGSGELLWQVEGTPRQQPLIHVGQRGEVCRYDQGLSRIDWATGETTPLAPGALSEPTFHVSPGGKVAIVRDGALEVYTDGELAWACKESDFAGRPRWFADLVVAADHGGTVYALDPAKQKSVWRHELSAGPVRLYAGRMRIFADDGRHVHALDPSSGKPLWKHETGDVLVSPPAKGADGILVACKLSKLWVLDPASGAVKAQKTWPTWLKSVSVVDRGQTAVVVDLRNRVSSLDTKDLRLLGQRSFDAALRPEVWYAESVPLVWQSAREKVEDEMDRLVDESKSIPAVLCQDEAGFVYMVPAP